MEHLYCSYCSVKHTRDNWQTMHWTVNFDPESGRIFVLYFSVFGRHQKTIPVTLFGPWVGASSKLIHQYTFQKPSTPLQMLHFSQIDANVVRAHACCACEGGRSGHLTWHYSFFFFFFHSRSFLPQGVYIWVWIFACLSKKQKK